jgi:L-fuculose-phosphate aldolase
LGKPATLQPNPLAAEVRARRHGQIMTPAHIEHSWDYFCRRLDG